jgi:hypothetical protein
MTAAIKPAGLVLAALLLIAGCGGSASTGHTARSALSSYAQANRALSGLGISFDG